ncbi:MAG: hypothetical protein M1823_001298 [Watsoniomyces obsoletus]|nr:MAG: hypothetical protein M1823_001298 [Watsoniomyces obsoletus]
MQRLILLLALFEGARGAPSISFPLNSQVPPVARVGETFQFTFARTSFTTSASAINYSISNASSWLQLDGSARSLFGTPKAGDVGPDEFVLTATDETGSTDMEVTLVVSEEPAPKLARPVDDQLATLGVLSSPNSLAFYPSSSFELRFGPDTFSATQQTLQYYAVSSDHTPLPAWVFFDPQTLTFSGMTPPLASLIEPPQTFGIKLIASDVAGFTGAAMDFNLVVGSRELTFGTSELLVKVNKGEKLQYSGLRDALRLDDKPIKPEELVSVEADVPDWLQLDQRTLDLTGTPPDDVSSNNFTVLVRDVYRDAANVTVVLQVQSSLFAQPIPDQTATTGQAFEYALPSGTLIEKDVDASSNTTPAAPWLNFNSNALKWSGMVPNDFPPGLILVKITITSRVTKVSETQSFKLTVVRTASPSPSSSSTSAIAMPTANRVSRSNTSRSVRAKLILAIVLPVVVLVGVVIVLFCCWKSVHERAKEQKSARRTSRNISRPLEHGFGAELEMGPPDPPTPEPPPKLPWPARFSGIFKSSSDLHGIRDQSGDARPSDGIDLTTFHVPHDQRRLSRPQMDSFSSLPSQSTPGKAPPRPLRPDETPTSSHRRSMRYSPHSKPGPRQLSDVFEGIATQTRVGGGNPALTKNHSRATWATTLGSSSSLAVSTDLANNFPELPKPTAQAPAPLSIRIVPGSQTNSLSTRRAERYGYSREGGSPYFGGATRVSSSRRQTWRKTKGRSILGSSPNDIAIESILRSLTDIGDPSSSDVPPSSPGSPSYPRVISVNGQVVPKRTFGSRISGNMGRISRPLSSTSSRYPSRSPSMQSQGSIFGRDYQQLPDEHGHRRWYQGARSSRYLDDLIRDGGKSRLDEQDENENENEPEPMDIDHDQDHELGPEHQLVELGVASMAHRPSTPWMPHWPSPPPEGPLTPRLVDLRRKRPVSMALDRLKGANIESSRSASLASMIRSDMDERTPGSDHKAFI